MLKIQSFMDSQIWGYMNSLYDSFGLCHFFFPQKNSCFSSQKCLGITASKFQFYCMKYLMFCLKQESIEESVYRLILIFQFGWLYFGLLHLVWCLMVWKIFHSGAKCSLPLRSHKSILLWQYSMQLQRSVGHSPCKFVLNTQSCICELTGSPLILSCTKYKNW